MKQLNKIQSIVFLLGGALMVVGAGCCAFLWRQQVFSFVFLVGAIMFSLMQCMQSYEGDDIVVRRLKRIMSIADLLFVVAGIVLVETANGFIRDIVAQDGGNGYINYYTYIYNKWVLLLLVAAFLELYTVHRISSELKKKNHLKTDE